MVKKWLILYYSYSYSYAETRAAPQSHSYIHYLSLCYDLSSIQCSGETWAGPHSHC